MPFGDRTGPLGLGPRTGRAMGFCAGFEVPGSVNPFPGQGWLGFGRGRGRGWFGGGRGWRHRYWATGLPEWGRAGYGYTPFVPYPYVPESIGKQEMDILKDQADFLKKQLEDIERRISTLKKTQSQEGE
jgi:hypothetical protein